MCFILAAMIAGAPVIVPERIDAEPVSVWLTTEGLIDDRPPRLSIDRSALSMDGDLAEASGLPASVEHDWHLIAADLAEGYGEAEAPAAPSSDNVGTTSIHSEGAPTVRR